MKAIITDIPAKLYKERRCQCGKQGALIRTVMPKQNPYIAEDGIPTHVFEWELAECLHCGQKVMTPVREYGVRRIIVGVEQS